MTMGRPAVTFMSQAVLPRAIRFDITVRYVTSEWWLLRDRFSVCRFCELLLQLLFLLPVNIIVSACCILILRRWPTAPSTAPATPHPRGYGATGYVATTPTGRDAVRPPRCRPDRWWGILFWKTYSPWYFPRDRGPAGRRTTVSTYTAVVGRAALMMMRSPDDGRGTTNVIVIYSRFRNTAAGVFFSAPTCLRVHTAKWSIDDALWRPVAAVGLYA